MKLIISLLAIIISTAVFAVGPPVPEEFIGIWVPVKNSCESKNKLQITKNNVTLINSSDKKQFGNIDICYSCEGGIRYSGEVVWLTPEFNSGGMSPFFVYFNANEETGITVVDIQDHELKRRFTLHNLKLKKCK